MNNRQKIVLLIAAVLLIGVFTWWLASGGEVLSKDGIWVEKEMTELDKALGLKPELDFQEKFILGLLPHTAVFSGAVVILSVLLFFTLKTKKNKETK
ncbi:MAG: hypothetical protein WBQ32_13845 [Ignavibacteriaceae bacterium]